MASSLNINYIIEFNINISLRQREPMNIFTFFAFLNHLFYFDNFTNYKVLNIELQKYVSHIKFHIRHMMAYNSTSGYMNPPILFQHVASWTLNLEIWMKISRLMFYNWILNIPYLKISLCLISNFSDNFVEDKIFSPLKDRKI